MRLSAFSLGLLVFALSARAETSLTVDTGGGAYQGREVKGARLFPNIAYAKPPVGALRWRRPVAEEKAIQRASPVQCPQALSDTFKNDPMDMSEDCLYLNVWAPPAGEGHPVVLFIHGGAYLTGTGLKSFYDGSIFARRGILFVGINYRLGDLGYGPHFSKEPGSPGLLDQATALQWVIRNIRRFGGDPNRIFLMGQSKGAEATSALLESGLADEHVQGAVSFSGPRHFPPFHNDFFRREPNLFLAGEPFMEAHDFLSEWGWRLITPEVPAVRTDGQGTHRFRVLVTGIQNEHGETIFCYDLDFLFHAYDYIDAYFYELHPGTTDHGSELISLFSQDEYGKRLLDHVAHFIEVGAPVNPHFFGSVRPFRESREVIHLFPRFTLTETVADQAEFSTMKCEAESPRGAFERWKLGLAERLSQLLGGQAAAGNFDRLWALRQQK